jgi:cold-inducible RNA-binding protein
MNNKLFVANLAYSITEDALRDLFGQYGEVVSVKIVTDTFTGRSKGFGFVEMDTKESAGAAAQGLNNKDCEGRGLKVDFAKPREAGAPRAGGFGGGDRPGRSFDRGGGSSSSSSSQGGFRKRY